MHQWHVYSGFEQVSKAAAEALAERIASCVESNGICHVILPGGQTPAKCLAYLAEKELPWNDIHWYLSDERCYPSGHEERNDVMLQNHLWLQLHISENNIHRIPAELGPEVAASLYREIIRPVKHFDIAFLGMGEDGHTASLFPDNKALHDKRSVVPVFDSPKLPNERVSLGIITLQNAHYRMVLISGAAKADIVARIKQGELLPINSLGDIEWYVDQAAVAKKI